MANICASDPRLAPAMQAVLDRGETGLSIAAYYRGRLIAEGTAGQADVAEKRPVTSGTLFPVFSVTKGITALAVHIQADRGHLCLQNPVAKYWPEFAVNGKETTTIEMALSHRAGIPQMPDDVTPELMANWDWMVRKVASFTPKFEPGTANAYHVLVWGWILGEVVVRTDPKHRPFGQFVAEEIASPLGVKDLFLGVPDTHLSRVATLYGGNEPFLEDTYNTSPMPVFPGANVHNLKVVQQACDPGAGAIGNAPAIARVFAAIAEGGELDGVRLLSRDYVKGLTRLREGALDPDRVLPIPVWFGAAGYWLGGEEGASDPIVGDHREIIYSPGAGGSLAWADIRDRIAVSICHNNMDAGVSIDPEPIWAPIGRAIREIIAEHQDQVDSGV
ncbi:beta-lactamase/transpeptidase-like protein [Dactylonectria macrodidyma]|uniref:Beta-lactamase/transpeptidase-like protein n=1 Tax=Dactylonectria macrodidyma TaxID=307937 RepID=A0A9P9EXI0_9HYPO|nr:beta-lactamase/transpeptidase-like protein [Dactylonectria macrodidyma]